MATLCLMATSPRMLNEVLNVFIAKLLALCLKEFLGQICRYVVQLC